MENLKLTIKGYDDGDREPEKKKFKPRKPPIPTKPKDIIPKKPLRLSSKYHYFTLDYILLILLIIGSFCAVVFTYKGIGYSWDEAYYYEPSKLAIEWVTNFLTGNPLISHNDINDYWSEIPELPAMTKIIIGAGHKFFSNTFGELIALRLPIAFVFALTIGLLFHIGLREYGRLTGIFAALSYLFMPRIFGHAHIAATETIMNFMTLFVVYCFIKGIRNVGWSILFGIALGLAFNTKINALFIPFVLILWAHIYYRHKYANNVFAIFFIAPLVFVLTWAWLWHDGPSKIADYLGFFARHQFTSVWYFGRTWGYFETAPWHYPFLMFFFTVPIPALIAICVGIGRTIFEIRAQSRGVLLLMMACFPLCLSALPNSPKYDGIRLFSTAFPFLALLGGIGFSGVLEWFRTGEKIKGAIYPRDLAAICCFVLFGVYGCWTLYYYHPHELSYYNYNLIVGGVRSAETMGMEITYWGEGINEEVLEFLNDKENIPENSKIMALALHGKVFDDLQQWGDLRKDLIFTYEPPVDFHILQYRKGFFGKDERFLTDSWAPFKVFDFENVPIVMIFKTGEEFEKKRTEWKQKNLGNP